MAIYSQKRIRVTDANGDPVAGGKVRLRDENTTDLAAVYSDAALTTPLTNPVVADANGWTPVIFGAEGLTVDVAYLDADDVEIPGTSEESVTFVGADSGNFTRTVSGNGRYSLTGSAGTVIQEFGDPDPDDTGGSAIMRGWNGTQGDSLTLNFASVIAATSAGGLTENSKKLPGVVTTEATTFTAASTVDIELPNSPTGVIAWDIEIWDLLMSTTANLWGRFSYDGGSNYKSGASDYFGHFMTSAAASTAASADLTQARMELVSNMQGSATRVGIGRIRVITNAGSVFTRLSSRFEGITNGPALTIALANWFGEGGYGRATHLRLLPASGTITGKYRVTPLRGFGE
jgi:hypothetical protein